MRTEQRWPLIPKSNKLGIPWVSSIENATDPPELGEIWIVKSYQKGQWCHQALLQQKFLSSLKYHSVILWSRLHSNYVHYHEQQRVHGLPQEETNLTWAWNQCNKNVISSLWLFAPLFPKNLSETRLPSSSSTSIFWAPLEATDASCIPEYIKAPELLPSSGLALIFQTTP